MHLQKSNKKDEIIRKEKRESVYSPKIESMLAITVLTIAIQTQQHHHKQLYDYPGGMVGGPCQQHPVLSCKRSAPP